MREHADVQPAAQLHSERKVPETSTCRSTGRAYLGPSYSGAFENSIFYNLEPLLFLGVDRLPYVPVIFL